MSLIEIDIDPGVFLPAYQHLLKSDADIDLLFGGRDSGKSHFVAQKSVIDCLHDDYFRMVLIKKTAESIKDSQYKTLLEIIEEWKIDELFSSLKNPLEIHCANLNQFLARGCDNPQKLKSIRNPSHAWYEEGDQLTEEDYTTASTSLRSNRGKVKEYLSFNPEAEGDYKQHWIYKRFHQKESNRMYGNFKSEKLVKIPGEKNPIKIRYTSTHTTYHNNPYCTPERRAKLEDLKETNPYYYQVYALGRWGVKAVKSPFLFTFKQEKHVGHTQWDPSQITYLSFDFNKNPISCLVFQWYGGEFFGIEMIKLKHSDIEQLCLVIAAKYQEALFVVVGDSTGYNNTALVKDDVNFYTEIIKHLQLEETQVQVIRNPIVEENQVVMNKIFHKVPITLDEDNCASLIFDCMFAEMRADGKLKKADREDETQQLDALDCFIGETLVQTEYGAKRIDQIKLGEYVVTSTGMRQVVDTWSSIAEVYEYTFSDGTKITCTKNHKFYAQSFGFIKIFDIFTQNISVCKKHSGTTAEVTRLTQNKTFTTPQIRGTQNHFIGRFISTILGLFQRACTFITKMKTSSITILKTLRLLMAGSISGGTFWSAWQKILIWLLGYKMKELSMLPNGINHQRGWRGITSMRKDSVSESLIMELLNVSSAEKDTIEKLCVQDFATTTARVHGEGKTIPTRRLQLAKNAEFNFKPTSITPPNIAPDHADLLQTHTEVKVVSMRKIGSKRVFDITVEKDHEFYANGILVHNCLRYAINTIVAPEFNS